MRRLAILLPIVGCLNGCVGDSTDSPSTPSPLTVSLSDSPSAQIWQGQCAACHGAAGKGNRALGAPALTQLSTDYLARQLRHFVSGLRGAHPDDDAGKRMALSVANLNEAGIPGLAVLITTELPRPTRHHNHRQRGPRRTTTSISAVPAMAVTAKATTHSVHRHSRASMTGI